MIHTLTLNPTLDLTYVVDHFKDEDTTRATQTLRAPGGKGINVARVATRLGHAAIALGFTGGHTGLAVMEMLEAEGVPCWFVGVDGETRTNPIIQDASGRHLRVSGIGPSATSAQVRLLWDAVFSLRVPHWLLLSGSRLSGMPEDFYARVIARAHTDKIKVVVDADGKDLVTAAGLGVALLKPNRFELERLHGAPLPTQHDVLGACDALLRRGVGAVAASLGAEGAFLVRPDGAWHAKAPAVQVQSTVGAGDSFLAGLCSQLAEGVVPQEALRFAVACGSATASAPNRSFCTLESVRALLPRVEANAVV